jgi:catechol 2,3-dioxygenase-like lactoylglutathione lyase family enzyme
VTEAFDRIGIAVPDLAAAVAAYRLLLDIVPCLASDESGAEVAFFDLGNTVLALRETPGSAARIEALYLGDPRMQGASAAHYSAGENDWVEQRRSLDNARGLALHTCDGGLTRALRRSSCGSAPGRFTVDHLVLRTADAASCIALFRDQLGIRLALELDRPEWGGRMLFFRAGGMTLEVIAPHSAPPGRDRFWGVAFGCADLAAETARLADAGVALTAVRAGRKPGTLVATVKSHHLDLPTLLMQPA